VDKTYKIYDSYNFDAAINNNSKVKEIQDMGNVYKKITLGGVEKTIIVKFYFNL